MAKNQPDPPWLASSRRLMEALDREVRRGSIRQMERSPGLKKEKGWWQSRVKAGHITTNQYVAVCDFLGLDPARFLQEALDPKGGLGLHRPKGEPPEIVKRAWERFYDDGDFPGTLGGDMLRTLDRMRFEAPQQVVKQASSLVDYCPRLLLPRLLGITGSSWRLMVCLDDAEHAIHSAVRMAQALEQQKVLGEMLQRLSYVVAERGNFGSALVLAEKATTIFLRARSNDGAAKTLVDQGIWLRLLGHRDQAIAVQSTALDWLPEYEAHNRFAAFQNIGLNYRELGEPHKAMEYCLQAEEVAVGLPRVEKDRGKWLRANILADLGNLNEGARLLQEVVEGLAKIQLGDMALAACDLARVEMLRGKPIEAFKAAKRLLPILEPLRDNKIIGAAISELIWSGEAGVTLALIEHTRTQIEGELQRQALWRRLWVNRGGN